MRRCIFKYKLLGLKKKIIFIVFSNGQFFFNLSFFSFSSFNSFFYKCKYDFIKLGKL